MKRDGASPVVAALVVSVDAAGEADSVAVAAGVADSVTAGVAGFVESFFDCCDATIAVKIATPRSTAMRTLFDEPWRGAAVGFATGVTGFGAAGVVETLTRSREAPVGTGGITTEAGALLRAGDFFTVFLAAAFLTVLFFATAFLATAFFATFLGADFFATFLAVVFLAADFFATVFFAVVFFATDFFATDFFATFLAVVFFGAAFLATAFFFTATFISSGCALTVNCSTYGKSLA